jgi:enoyl-CoA hydratase
VVAVRRSALEDGGAQGRAFFHAEYRLNHLLFSYPKPVVAFMDGVTMGGGVGIACPARYRIATQNTRLAMPEGAIGLFPDVGAGWYLPRLPGRIGKFLALTGATLDGAECLWTGLATHYLPADRLAQAKERIAADPGALQVVLASYSVSLPGARLAGNAERIDRLFAPDTLEGIMAALAADPSEWAAKELRAVSAKCPTTAKVTLRQFALSAGQPDFAAEMALEYRLAARMIMRNDFIEGVRAVLVDKDNAPAWSPATAEDVSEAMLDAIFAPLPEGEEWTPLGS